MQFLPTLLRPKQDPRELQIRADLLKDIWSFPGTLPEPKAASCFNHYKRLLEDPRVLDQNFVALKDSTTTATEVIGFIKELKTKLNIPLKQVRNSLKANPPAWLQAALITDPGAIDKVLDFAARLWLFTRFDLTDENVTLGKAAKTRLEKIKGTARTSFMWLEFSAKTLDESAGIRIIWTSNVAEHLTFESRFAIRVFTHASVLERFESTDEKGAYPDGLLRELRRTLNLLWPMEDHPTEKYVRNLEKRENIDIEASMRHDEKFSLLSYPIFGERLGKIQERLESVKTRRSASLGFKIAISGIVLTAFFGLISAVTGIVQVWAALKPDDNPLVELKMATGRET